MSLQISASFQQSPVELKRYLLDWTAQLAQGETVTAIQATVSSVTDPSNLGGAQVTGVAIAPLGNQAVFFMSFTNPGPGPNTADGQTYLVSFVATTSLTQKWQDMVQFVVANKNGV
jgi:hypothetical protein